MKPYDKHRWIAICFVALLLLALPVFAQIDVQQRLATAPTLKDYPSIDGIMLLEKRNLKMNEDGVIIERTYRLFKIFAQVGLYAYSDPRFQFDSRTEEVTIIRACTHMADGTVVELPENARHWLTPSAVAEAPAYVHIQELALNHTALEKNAVIELEVEKRRRASGNSLAGWEVFVSRFPVLEKELTVTIPRSRDLDFAVQPPEFQPEVREEGLFRTYIWQAKSLPPIPKEAGAPPLEALARRVIYATRNPWEKVLEDFRHQLKEDLSLSEAAKSKVHHLTENALLPGDKLRAIHSYVVDVVNRVPLTFALCGGQVRPASEVFDSNYGLSLEKGVLLQAMLQEAGIPANLAFTVPTYRFAQQVPSLQLFEDVWVVAEVAGASYWLHPDYETVAARKRLLNTMALVLTPEGHRFVEHAPTSYEGNGIRLATTAALKEDGSCEGKAAVLLSGYFHSGAGPVEADQMEKLAKEAIAALFADAEIKDCQLHQSSPTSLEMEFGFAASKAVSIIDHTVYLKLNRPYVYASVFEIPLSHAERKTMLELPVPFSESLDCFFELPKTWEIAYRPEELSLGNEAGRIHIQFSTGENKVRLRKELLVKKRQILPQNYSDFRRLLGDGQLERNHTVIFKTD